MVKKNKRQQNIKTKLIAAICMLLVSSIMMVSSTYAWFTLSTAPEVTGITTSVGANGNLEIALMPATGGTAAITSSAGDSTKAVKERNVTWGNLVDVSDSTFYGMDKITLYPAELNAATGDTNGNPLTLAAAMLKTPTYGADGRVADLVANTVTSTYNSTSKNFPTNSEYGVRAVGDASGMTDQQLAYRNAMSAANTAMAQAKTFASQSLNTNGASLANIALAHGTDSTALHTEADVKNLLAIVNDLLGTSSTTGVLEYVEDAYAKYLYALLISNKTKITNEEFQVIKGICEAKDATVYTIITALKAQSITIPAVVATPIALLKATRQNVENAQTGLNALLANDAAHEDNEKYITWNDISVPLYKLADTGAMKINGYAASTVQDNMSAIINSVASQGLTVTIATGGGVYADIADHCGDYNASVIIEKVEYGDLALENMNARMQTATTVTPVYLSALGTAVTAADSPETADGTIMPITDMYGYIIDLAFRTNAAESDLLLQVDATDRIYSDNGDEETMGHGSSMTFTTTTTDFTVDQMKGLMSAIRIVFFDGSGNVLATAKLDTVNATVTGGNTATAKMYLYTLTKESTTSYTKVEDNTTLDVDNGVYYTMSEQPKYTVVSDTTDTTKTYYVLGDDGSYTSVTDTTDTAKTYYVQDGTEKVYTKVTDNSTLDATNGVYYTATTTSADTATEVKKTDNKITALTQNQAQQVSVLVYLDGNYVSNGSVAATAATSMTGTMNLQFASSATLVPMEYADLHINAPTDGSSSETPSESSGT